FGVLLCDLALCFSSSAPPALSPLSLHAALPILARLVHRGQVAGVHPAVGVDCLSGLVGFVPVPAHHRVAACAQLPGLTARLLGEDRKSTRLNSSHVSISYAVFCLKKKRKRCGN